MEMRTETSPSNPQTEAREAGLTWVQDRGILVASDPGAVELWELDENETLIDNKFCKYKHNDIVSTVSVLSSGTHAVSGSKDFWWVPALIAPVSGPSLGVLDVTLASLSNVLGSL